MSATILIRFPRLHRRLRQEDKFHIHDLHATILALLGLNHKQLTYKYAGRDFRLTDVEGHVVLEIFS